VFLASRCSRAKPSSRWTPDAGWSGRFLVFRPIAAGQGPPRDVNFEEVWPLNGGRGDVSYSPSLTSPAVGFQNQRARTVTSSGWRNRKLSSAITHSRPLIGGHFFLVLGYIDNEQPSYRSRITRIVLEEAEATASATTKAASTTACVTLISGYCTLAQIATRGLVAARLAGHETVRSLTRVTAVLPGPQ
jgi:hypothetical protein